jgi:serine/threonine protein kinase
VVAVYEAGDSPYGPFIAMRMVRGESLKRLIVSGQLDIGRALEILGGVADGLDAAHREGLIHRDIKPSNILVDGDYGFLADFGLSTGSGLESITASPGQPGTPAYMAPEQIRGEHAEARSDIYALGAVLYECLTSSPPFPRSCKLEVMFAHLYSSLPSVRMLRVELPDAVNQVLARAMAKQPEQRQPSAAQLLAEARAALEGDVLPEGSAAPRSHEPPAGRLTHVSERVRAASASTGQSATSMTPSASGPASWWQQPLPPRSAPRFSARPAVWRAQQH